MPILPLCFSLISFFTGADKPGDPINAELLFVGDAMQHQAQIDRANELSACNDYNYDDCFSLIAPTITEADFAVCNLETPLGGGPKYTGFPCFSAPDSFAASLQCAGFDLMLTANNHALDRSDKGVWRTIEVLDKMHIDHIGTYKNIECRKKSIPYIKNIHGFKIGFLNYTYGTNGLTAKKGAEISLINRDEIKNEITLTRSSGAEIVVVCIHWGVEYILTENTNQQELAHFLIDNDVDIIIGSHPHVIQPMKIIKNESTGRQIPVIYSLGNFISNMKTNDTRGGALVRCRIERDKNGKAIFKGANYDTFFAAKPEGSLSNFCVIPSWLTLHIPTKQRTHWTLFNQASQKIFDNHNIGIDRQHK